MFSQEDDIYYSDTVSKKQLKIKEDSVIFTGSSAGIRMGFGAMHEIPGLVLGFDYTWFDNKYFGIGGKYVFFQNRSSQMYSLTVHYFAPMLTFRTGKETFFYSNVCLGLVLLDDFGGYVSQDGFTGGSCIDLGVDLKVFKNRYMGFKISGLYAILPYYNINSPVGTTQNDKPSSISRLEFTLGYKFY